MTETGTERRIAYFSMEIGLDAAIPTYSGGLGILAGDSIRSAVELKVPLVAVTLLHKKGYFYQKLASDGWQTEEPVEWMVDDFLELTGKIATVSIEDRDVQIRAWKYQVGKPDGFTVPVYFLDTDMPENKEWDRTLTHYLYGGDSYYRLCQEIVLGIGGVRILNALGYEKLERYHMNEGHSSFLTLELLEESVRKSNKETVTMDNIEEVRKKCVFTTHTPVPAGHDKFPMDMVRRVLGNLRVFELKDVYCCDETFNMTYLALALSHYVNGVAKKHGETSQHIYAPYVIDSITNGVHAATWVSEPLAKIFNQYIPTWREDNFSLRYALNISTKQLWEAHIKAKQNLIQYANRETNTGLDTDWLTLGFARRATEYKRPELLFTDCQRLKAIASSAGAFQIIFAGKAHPNDNAGKEIIKRIFQQIHLCKPEIKIAYLQNYDIELGKLITSGVDIWLNTPQPPLEASGTSGMKAALNGIPSLSILDGWWIEGCIEGITGWAIGQYSEDKQAQRDNRADAAALYDKLEAVIIPMFYKNPEQFRNIMLHCIALNGSFFNTQRMMQQYVLKAYFS
ncbi:MAG: alpha-glucan family phosphorylase [Planctomycetota bacterium]|jgi:starch phosphorylase